MELVSVFSVPERVVSLFRGSFLTSRANFEKAKAKAACVKIVGMTILDFRF
jgi:hypothetical protein